MVKIMFRKQIRSKTLVAAASVIFGMLSAVMMQTYPNAIAQERTEPKTESKKLTPVLVQDFEKTSHKPTVWVVNIPNENAAVQLSTDHPHEGKQCLKLHYHFVGTGQFQYLGIPNKTKIQAPVHRLRYMLYGDNSKCSYGVQITDARGETHQFSK